MRPPTRPRAHRHSRPFPDRARSSSWLRSRLTGAEYKAVARAADVCTWDTAAEGDRGAARRACKTVVEWDRRGALAEAGYACALSLMEPLSASPKNDIIVAVPAGEAAPCAAAAGEAGKAEAWTRLLC